MGGEMIPYDGAVTAIDRKGRAKASVPRTKDGGTTGIEAEIGGVGPGFEERKGLRHRCRFILIQPAHYSDAFL